MAEKGGKGPPLIAERRYRAEAKPAPKPARAARPAGRRAPRRRRGLLAGLVLGLARVIWGLAWRSAAALAIGLGLWAGYFYAGLPAMDDLIDARTRGSVTMLDTDGRVFAWRGETFGGRITADTVSPYLKNAVIATEDKRFYRHFGVSPRGIASAISINLAAGRGPFEGNGGSTITQQVAKLLCLGVTYDKAVWATEKDYEDDCRQGGIWRKIKEVPYALALEAKYSKDEILTIYFNRAYLGAGARGFEAAAQRYFGKSANEVTPAEAAMLAGLLKAPSYYAPTNNLDRARERANVILGLMHEQGYLTDAEYADAKAHPAKLSKAAAAKAGGYFADWVMETAPDFLSSNTTEDVVVRTTLDPRIQKAAEEALAAVFETKVKDGSKAQAAIVVMSADGAVRAMVGGRDTQAAGAFNRATQALRQTGSTFKPFVYAAALDMGYSPYSIVEDAPVCIDVPGSSTWCPENYDPEYRGPITLIEALAHSVNTATVRVSQAVGLDAVRRVASGFGFASKLADGPALALGVSESTLIEMTGAYAGILNGGTAVQPYGLVELTIQGEGEPLIGKTGGYGERVISEQAARELIYMMSRVIEEGTGRRARLEGHEAAGKTGTTQAARDAWFIGFTADYVTGVWMGYDDNTPLKGTTGGGLPAEIWHEVMTRVEAGLPATPLPMIVPDPYTGGPAYAGETWGAGSGYGYGDGTGMMPLPEAATAPLPGADVPPLPGPGEEMILSDEGQPVTKRKKKHRNAIEDVLNTIFGGGN
ncbi:MAG: PBP1A family penicillin-binding protein [Rhodobacteraceae bacterium]|nr:PBP1A family penicillin-binding protein [Paracoccaceae bacterium]